MPNPNRLVVAILRNTNVKGECGKLRKALKIARNQKRASIKTEKPKNVATEFQQETTGLNGVAANQSDQGKPSNQVSAAESKEAPKKAKAKKHDLNVAFDFDELERNRREPEYQDLGILDNDLEQLRQFNGFTPLMIAHAIGQQDAVETLEKSYATKIETIKLLQPVLQYLSTTKHDDLFKKVVVTHMHLAAQLGCQLRLDMSHQDGLVLSDKIYKKLLNQPSWLTIKLPNKRKWILQEYAGSEKIRAKGQEKNILEEFFTLMRDAKTIFLDVLGIEEDPVDFEINTTYLVRAIIVSGVTKQALQIDNLLEQGCDFAQAPKEDLQFAVRFVISSCNAKTQDNEADNNILEPIIDALLKAGCHELLYTPMGHGITCASALLDKGYSRLSQRIEATRIAAEKEKQQEVKMEPAPVLQLTLAANPAIVSPQEPMVKPSEMKMAVVNGSGPGVKTTANGKSDASIAVESEPSEVKSAISSSTVTLARLQSTGAGRQNLKSAQGKQDLPPAKRAWDPSASSSFAATLKDGTKHREAMAQGSPYSQPLSARGRRRKPQHPRVISAAAVPGAIESPRSKP